MSEGYIPRDGPARDGPQGRTYYQPESKRMDPGTAIAAYGGDGRLVVPFGAESGRKVSTWRSYN